jgi:hypothetical protein
MRMTARDRLEAIKRCPEYLAYQKALRAYHRSKETDPKKRRALLGEIRFSWDPLELLALSLPAELHDFDEHMAGLLKSLDREAIVVVKESQWPRPRGEAEPRPGAVWTLHKGRMFVRLKIDLHRTEGELTKAFARMIRAWKAFARKHQYLPEGRARKQTKPSKDGTNQSYYDPWEIYDLCKKGMSLSSIVLNKTGHINPVYNPEASASYKRVERAYTQAERMIQTVSAEAKSWLPKNRPLVLPPS